MPVRTRRSGVLSSIVVGAVALGLSAACVALGAWQWDRAHTRAEAGVAAAPLPLAGVLAPSTDAHGTIGTSVVATGIFSDEVALVSGREVDGVAAVMLVRALTITPDATGTGEPATLAVLVGYADEADVAQGTVSCPTVTGERVTVTGYLRGSESPPAAGTTPTAARVCGVAETTTLSTADLAQSWPAPMYSAVLVSIDGDEGWEPVPRPEPSADVNLQSLAYSVEWWVFAAFALVVAGRWIRDNGREQTDAQREARRDG